LCKEIRLFFDSNCNLHEHKTAARYYEGTRGGESERGHCAAWCLLESLSKFLKLKFFFEILQKANAKETRKSAGWREEKKETETEQQGE